MDLDGVDAGPRRLLGKAVMGRASEVGRAVVEAWRPRAVQVDVPQQQLEQSIEHTSEVGAQIIGRWLATGAGATPAETQYLAERSTDLIRDHFAMHSVVKNYLCWRDATLRVVREEACRLRSPEALVLEVSQAIRMSADTSIVNVIREYDAQLRQLQDALALERAKLTHLALHDPLTGLANRTLLLDRLNHTLAGSSRRGDRVGVLFLDLNGFKAINDRLGHSAGDRLLVNVAQRLSSLIRPSDTVARLGGDEFVIIGVFSAPGEQALTDLADRIRAGIAALSEPSQGLAVSVSIGSALGTDADDPEQLLAQADATMYAEKRHTATPATATHHLRSTVALRPVSELDAGPAA